MSISQSEAVWMALYNNDVVVFKMLTHLYIPLWVRKG